MTLKKLSYFIGPLLFILISWLDVFDEQSRSAVVGLAAWMIAWWVFEVFPIYVTALLPMVFFPALGVMSVKDTFAPYASPIVFLFLGGFLIALAMEERQLHKRIAFWMVRVTGTKPKGIILGFMLATASVAMWISNTATAVMMLPIGLSIIQLIQENDGETPFSKRFSLLLMLGIAYAANTGGIITLIGTPPNLVFAGYYFDRFNIDFAFSTWLAIGLPVGTLILLLGYFLLTSFVYPISNRSIIGVKELFDAKWRELGPISMPEKLVLVVFSLTVFAWIFLNPINETIGTQVLNNTNVAMAGGLLMFLVPVNWKENEFIIHWESTKKLPWGILILFGGGLCLAAGLEKVGVIDSVAIWVNESFNTGPITLCIALTLLSIFLTEFMSNVALVTVLLPVVFEIAEQSDVNPLLLTVPVTMAASCAFMMPISTPPNAIVYSSGSVTVKEMVKAGFWMNLLSAAVITILCYLMFA
ncbi:MAG: SLC13 family permease [Flavobacteriales bacterium]